MWTAAEVAGRVCITVDVEHDCPPFLSSYRGVTEGLPRLLELLGAESVRGTFFTTGDVARRHPEAVRAIVQGGHELGCHGDTHRRFGAMDAGEARRELGAAAAVLRGFGAEVRSFRAPNLDLPDAFLPLLVEAGFALDSSEGRHKPRTLWRRPSIHGALRRLPASTAPSLTRLPAWLRRAALGLLADPVVLFFHPWEFTDVTRAPIPLDCRYRTGAPAITSLRALIRERRARGASFYRVSDLPV